MPPRVSKPCTYTLTNDERPQTFLLVHDATHIRWMQKTREPIIPPPPSKNSWGNNVDGGKRKKMWLMMMDLGKAIREEDVANDDDGFG